MPKIKMLGEAKPPKRGKEQDSKAKTPKHGVKPSETEHVIHTETTVLSKFQRLNSHRRVLA